MSFKFLIIFLIYLKFALSITEIINVQDYLYQWKNDDIKLKFCQKISKSKKLDRIYEYQINSNPDVIFLINSVVNDITTRCAIRLSWSHFSKINYHNNLSYIVIFQIGKTNDQSLIKLQMENKIFNDIFIHSNVIDTYNNLTLKNIESWKKILKLYPKSKFIIKSDSDVFINMKLYLNHLYNLINNKTSNVFYEGLM